MGDEVQRGGAAWMLALLQDDPVRRVWLADSFKGLPPACDSPLDSNWWVGKSQFLGVSQSEVEANIAAAGLEPALAPRLLVGYFNETMPQLRPLGVRFSVLRVDGDMFLSYLDVLMNTYEVRALRPSPRAYVCACICASFAFNAFRASHFIQPSQHLVRTVTVGVAVTAAARPPAAMCSCSLSEASSSVTTAGSRRRWPRS